ncbi:hypothetical protein GCM10023095_05590 [Pseudaeromonas paramecii]|uniref:Uncharacterized protein n=1 Tax=Pseudaeromonas paramecii TaxID=2138166 RepID=A0ABP8Q0H6_9GAMM
MWLSDLDDKCPNLWQHTGVMGMGKPATHKPGLRLACYTAASSFLSAIRSAQNKDRYAHIIMDARLARAGVGAGHWDQSGRFHAKQR